MKRKSFELRAINLKNGHTGLSLYQYPLNGQAQGEKPRLVVRAGARRCRQLPARCLT